MIQKLLIVVLLLAILIVGIIMSVNKQNALNAVDLEEQIGQLGRTDRPDGTDLADKLTNDLTRSKGRYPSLSELNSLVRKLAGTDPEQLVPALKKNLLGDAASPDLGIQGGCAHILGQIKHPEAGRILVEVIKKNRSAQSVGEVYVLSSAIISVGEQAYPEAGGLLLEILTDAQAKPQVRRQAALALGRVDAKQYAPNLVRAFETGDTQLMLKVVAAFSAASGPEPSASLLLEAYEWRLDKPKRISLRPLEAAVALAASRREEKCAAPLKRLILRRWDRAEMRANYFAFKPDNGQSIGDETAPERLLSNISYALFLCSKGEGGLHTRLAKLDTLSHDLIAPVVRRYWRRLRDGGRSEETQEMANREARLVLTELNAMMDHSAPRRETAVLLLQQLNLIKKGGASEMAEEKVARCREWLKTGRESYDLWATYHGP